jgi:hypothetical protein
MTAVRLVVTRRATASVGLCSSSLTTDTITGVIAAAIQVPWTQNCEVTTAAAADATLAIPSVLIDRRRCSSRVRVRGGCVAIVLRSVARTGFV